MVQEERYSEADAWFAQAVELNPQQNYWWLAWGNAMRGSGDLPRALDIYGQTVEIFPDWAPGYYEMAWAFQLAGSNDRAIEAIEQALALLTPPSEWYYARAGRIYELADDETEAICIYITSIHSMSCSARVCMFNKNDPASSGI
jgi:tetratricopeptide (TPR) repeat protein